MKKICKKCKKEKSVSEFIKMGSHYCRECRLKKMNDYEIKRRKSIHHILYQREYGRTYQREYKKNNLEKCKEYARKNQKNNPLSSERLRVYYERNRAVKNGTLKVLPCSVCGNKKTETHHPDYSKPLDVVWLCSKHHGEVHRKYKT